MTYGVLWSENDGPEFAGRLELADGTVRLTGSAAGRPSRLDLRYDEVAEVFLERSAPRRHDWAPALVLLTHAGDRVEIGSLQGLGALHEVTARVAERLRETRNLDPQVPGRA